MCPFIRCDDVDRNALLGALERLSKSPPVCVYVPGPGVSLPADCTFSSRADIEPKPPAPARADRPCDERVVAARSREVYGSYAPGSPSDTSSSLSRLLPDLNAGVLPPLLLSPLRISYAPGPGVAARRCLIAACFAACSDARSDGVRSRPMGSRWWPAPALSPRRWLPWRCGAAQISPRKSEAIRVVLYLPHPWRAHARLSNTSNTSSNRITPAIGRGLIRSGDSSVRPTTDPTAVPRFEPPPSPCPRHCSHSC